MLYGNVDCLCQWPRNGQSRDMPGPKLCLLQHLATLHARTNPSDQGSCPILPSNLPAEATASRSANRSLRCGPRSRKEQRRNQSAVSFLQVASICLSSKRLIHIYIYTYVVHFNDMNLFNRHQKGKHFWGCSVRSRSTPRTQLAEFLRQPPPRSARPWPAKSVRNKTSRSHGVNFNRGPYKTVVFLLVSR